MSDAFEHTPRTGSASLSVLSFVGLGALAALIWQLAPGYVLLILIPALSVCLWQMVRVPNHGIRMTETAWHITGGPEDLVVPVAQIAYLRISDKDASREIGLMLQDNREIVLPLDILPDPLRLIREATARGIPVREIS